MSSTSPTAHAVALLSLSLAIALQATSATGATSVDDGLAHPATAEIYINKEDVGQRISNGHGMLISSDGLFFTAYHVIDEGFTVRTKVWIVFPGRQPMLAEYVDGSLKDDLALMRITGDISGIKPVTIAKDDPVCGSECLLQAAKHRDGRQILFECGPITSPDTVVGDATCWQGESGTGFLNLSGELVGILTGGWDFTRTVTGSRVKRFNDGGSLETYQVWPVMSRSTPSEMRAMVDKNTEKPTAKVDSLFRDYKPGDESLQGTSLMVFHAEW